MKYLGERFDIHTGGNDLRFPHHEDEIAQSEGAVGHEVVSSGSTAGHLRQSGQKISKSTGNVVRVHELVERGFDPLAFRWLAFQTRYRSPRWTSRGTPWRTPISACDSSGAGMPSGRPPRPSSPRRRARRSTAGSARPSPTTCDMPSAVEVVNELVVDRSGHRRREVRAARLLGRRPRARPRARGPRGLGAHRGDARADGRARRAPATRRTTRPATPCATALAAMGLEVMDTAAGTRVRPRHSSVAD